MIDEPKFEERVRKFAAGSTAPQRDVAILLRRLTEATKTLEELRTAALWVIWHHQGASSPIGQPLRLILGMSREQALSIGQVAQIKEFSKRNPWHATKAHASNFRDDED